MSRCIHSVKVLRPTRHKIRHSGDVFPANIAPEKLNLKQRKQTCMHNKIYYNTNTKD